MVFSSVIFLSVFLPSVFILYRLLPGIRLKNALLMLASILFYASGRLEWTPILLASVLINYTAGLFTAREGKLRRPALVLAVVLNLGILCIFKYLDFGASTINSVLGTSIPLPGIELPIGISFFTFQGLSYVIDVYRNPEEGTRNLGKVLLYISFFPQLIAGPIVRYLDVARQIDSRTTTPKETAEGICRFIAGMSKKLLIADTLGACADSVFALTPGQLDIRLAWLGAVCYTLQIYFDFSGYSDMAIGLGHMFGFTFRENFRHPYCARSIQDFWNRWHISLSTWFREYVYIPLGGNRKGELRANINRIIVFFLTGLWHGANWTFVLWGLWHGALRMIESRFQLQKKFEKGALRPLGHIWTMLGVILGFVLFRSPTVGAAWSVIRAMFTGFTFTRESSALFHNLFSPVLVFTILAACITALPVFEWAEEKLKSRPKALQAVHALCWPVSILLLVLCMLNLAATSFSPFIYFQF